MLDFNAPEFLVVAIVALIVIGPKDLPKAMRFLGKWVGRARGVARQFRSGFDNMIRESELAELEKQWAAENERIMRDHPVQQLPAPQPVTEHSEDTPVMTAMPEIKAEPLVEAPTPKPARARKPKAPVTGDTLEALAPKPRKAAAPKTGDTLEAPKPPRKPRAKAKS